MRYQTEIFVTDDRYVCLQLPSYLPEGRAVVTVTFEGPAEDPFEDEPEGDREWWEEADDDRPGR